MEGAGMREVEGEFEGILILEEEKSGGGGIGGVFCYWTVYGALGFGYSDRYGRLHSFV